MAWIELHDNLPNHEKVTKLAAMLHMDKDMAVGKLVRLWTWAINEREDGMLYQHDVSTIAEQMRFKGKPQRLVDALVACCLLDPCDGAYHIHKWEDRANRLIDSREEKRQADARRKQLERSRRRVRQSFAYDAWLGSFGIAPNPAQIENLESLSDKYETDVILELIRSAALAGADNPIAYITGICRCLDTYRIHTYAEYATYQDEIDDWKRKTTTEKALKTL